MHFGAPSCPFLVKPTGSNSELNTLTSYISPVYLKRTTVIRTSSKGPSTPYYRTFGPFAVPRTINKDYLDPSG